MQRSLGVAVESRDALPCMRAGEPWWGARESSAFSSSCWRRLARGKLRSPRSPASPASASSRLAAALADGTHDFQVHTGRCLAVPGEGITYWPVG